ALKSEGDIDWMYLDKLGWVTVGRGWLLADEGSVGSYQWKRDGGSASVDDAKARWRQLEALGKPIRDVEGTQSKTGGAFKDSGGVRLVADQSATTVRMLRGKYAAMKQWAEFKDFDAYPPDAQLAILVRSWGAFSPAAAPNFVKACAARDWLAARDAIT